MTDTASRDRIAEALGKHRLEAKSRTDACPYYPGFLTWHDGCTCGWVGKYRHDPESFVETISASDVLEILERWGV